jgi:hypothetical protein
MRSASARSAAAARDLEISRRGNTVRIETESARAPDPEHDIRDVVPTSIQSEHRWCQCAGYGRERAGRASQSRTWKARSSSQRDRPGRCRVRIGRHARERVRGDVSVSTTNKTVRLDDIAATSTRRRSTAASSCVASWRARRGEHGTGTRRVSRHAARRRALLPGHAQRPDHDERAGEHERAYQREHAQWKGRDIIPRAAHTMRERGEYTLTLGSGSARVELESFNGSVYLVRPGNR